MPSKHECVCVCVCVFVPACFVFPHACERCIYSKPQQEDAARVVAGEKRAVCSSLKAPDVFPGLNI